MGIQRWHNNQAFGNMFDCVDGDFVLFTDHEQAVAELEQRVIVAEDFCVERDREITRLRAELAAKSKDAERLDYIERKFAAVTTQERYLPLQMIWGKGCNGRTLREAVDKYMARDEMGKGNGR